MDEKEKSRVEPSIQFTVLTHTLVPLGKTLNLETLAEGIEDQRCWSATLQLLFSRPLEVGAVEVFLRTLRTAGSALSYSTQS